MEFDYLNANAKCVVLYKIALSFTKKGYTSLHV